MAAPSTVAETTPLKAAPPPTLASHPGLVALARESAAGITAREAAEALYGAPVPKHRLEDARAALAAQVQAGRLVHVPRSGGRAAGRWLASEELEAEELPKRKGQGGQRWQSKRRRGRR